MKIVDTFNCGVVYREFVQQIIGKLQAYDYDGTITFVPVYNKYKDSNGFEMVGIDAQVHGEYHDPKNEVQESYRGMINGYHSCLSDLGLLPYFNAEYQKDRASYVARYNAQA